MAKNEPITEAQLEQEAKTTGERLAKEPKIRIKIPKDPLNKGETTVPVGINGYFYYIKRGETGEVPKTVADLLEQAKYI